MSDREKLENMVLERQGLYAECRKLEQYIREYKTEIERLKEQMIESAKRYRRNIDEITKERDTLRTRLERVREKLSRKNTKRVTDFDDYIAELKKILDGEE